MPHKEKARRTWKSGRASVSKDKRIVPQEEWERGMRMLWIPFAALLALYAAWAVLAPCPL